jgi:hypothetical protein
MKNSLKLQGSELQNYEPQIYELQISDLPMKKPATCVAGFSFFGAAGRN